MIHYNARFQDRNVVGPGPETKQQHNLQAMVIPESAVVTAPHSSFRVTVPLVVGFQVSVVGDPTLKV